MFFRPPSVKMSLSVGPASSPEYAEESRTLEAQTLVEGGKEDRKERQAGRWDPNRCHSVFLFTVWVVDSCPYQMAAPGL